MDFNYLAPCPTEDSTNCYWDASIQGNGTGQSFANIDGVQYALDTPANHTIESVVAFADGTPGVAYQEGAPSTAYSVDLTLPVVLVAAALIACAVTLVIGFFRRA